jgi:hypothetical protein
MQIKLKTPGNNSRFGKTKNCAGKFPGLLKKINEAPYE